MGELSTQNALPEKVIERIFINLNAFYGVKFLDQFQNQDTKIVKNIWAKALASYSEIEIKTGVHACLASKWPPTLPEFLEFCRPVMEYEAAYNEACVQIRLRDSGRDTWSNPAVFYAAAEIGSDLSNSRYEQIKNRWKAVLDICIEKMRAGKLPEAVPKRLEALPAPGREATTSEEIKKHLESLRGIFSMGTAE